jgi:hypothetical protein
VIFTKCSNYKNNARHDYICSGLAFFGAFLFHLRNASSDRRWKPALVVLDRQFRQKRASYIVHPHCGTILGPLYLRDGDLVGTGLGIFCSCRTRYDRLFPRIPFC